MRSTMLGLFCCLAIGCTADRQEQNSPQVPNPQTKQDEVFRKQLLQIATEYTTYARPDDLMRWAPAYCAPAVPIEKLPDGSGEAKVRLSRSEDEATHGRKLYTIYARKYDFSLRSYTAESAPEGKQLPVTGQVIVKESWVPKTLKFVAPNSSFVRGSDGTLYVPNERGPLFVMFQTDPNTPGTDEGWVYGTLTPDGKTVTGVGRLQNCMSCHQKAPHGRLFGLPAE